MDTGLIGVLNGIALFIGYKIAKNWYSEVIMGYIKLTDPLVDQLNINNDLFIKSLEDKIDRLDGDDPEQVKKIAQCIDSIKKYREYKDIINKVKERTAIDRKRFS